jgi:hypothetical protein
VIPDIHYVRRDGISIAYQVFGEGPDLLFIPGFARVPATALKPRSRRLSCPGRRARSSGMSQVWTLASSFRIK